jgi:hypothetical protein
MPCAARLGSCRFGALGESSAELVAPATDRFVRDDDTSFEQQLLDVAQAQAEPEIPTNRAADDDGSKAVAVIKRFCLLHHFILPPPLHQPDKARARCLVTHQGNPPYLIPVIDIVPAPFTDDATIIRATAFYEAAGMSAARVTGENEGFIFNRLQGAVLREAYCPVRYGVASVADIDRVIRDGVGLSWSVTGPFETADLNTRGGIASHAQKMGPAYERMGASRGQHDPRTPDLVARVADERRAALPLDDWDVRVQRRDRRLMALIRDRRRAEG